MVTDSDIDLYSVMVFSSCNHVHEERINSSNKFYAL